MAVQGSPKRKNGVKKNKLRLDLEATPGFGAGPQKPVSKMDTFGRVAHIGADTGTEDISSRDGTAGDDVEWWATLSHRFEISAQERRYPDTFATDEGCSQLIVQMFQQRRIQQAPPCKKAIAKFEAETLHRPYPHRRNSWKPPHPSSAPTACW